MTSSAFSFHCMICFEKFDPQTNYPVVLPCGHTYVCIECANRLDKCMECRMPLTIKAELPPTPSPSLVTPGSSIPAAVTVSATGAYRPDTNNSPADAQKENFADGVRNSPQFHKRSGTYNRHHSAEKQSHLLNHHRPIQKQRLPLPKNSVLLSLIQASEPARRRAEGKGPPTSQINNDAFLALKTGSNSRYETPAPENPPLLKSSRPSPLFFDNSSCREQPHLSTSYDASFEMKNSVAGINGKFILGSFPDEEEHKIRVGTLIEGGPCGTYAVAARGGLLVYPTLFEHTPPSVLDGWTKRCGGKGGAKGTCDEDEVDVVKRDVEELVKNHRASAGRRNFPGSKEYGKDAAAGGCGGGSSRISGSGTLNTTPERKNYGAKEIMNDDLGDSTTQLATIILSKNGEMLRGSSPVTTELGVSHTWVECRSENTENFEAMLKESMQASHCGAMGGTRGTEEAGCDCTSTTSVDNIIGISGNDDGVSASSSSLQSPAGLAIPMMSESNNEEDGNEREPLSRDQSEFMSNPGGSSGGSYLQKLDRITNMAATQYKIAAISNVNHDDDVAGLVHSLTISEDEDFSINIDDNDGGNHIDMVDLSVRTHSARHLRTIAGVTAPSSPLTKDEASGTITHKNVQHFSQGCKRPEGVPLSSQSQHIRIKKCVPDGGCGDKENHLLDEFDQPLSRLKYGDRVQVVSMDLKGWVKLARGYGYIRLENDKQLVKVGGTSDKACQIESMVHELCIERNRIEHEQTKLERVSARLMIDLQTTLTTSDDNVVVPAPEVSLQRTNSENSLSILGTGSKLENSIPNISIDGMDVSTCSRAILTPPKHCGNNQEQSSSYHPHRPIRTAKLHSPGRTHATPKAATSRPYSQVISNTTSQQLETSISRTNTPTRVNFQTGLSGHRALSSPHSHPHDFLGGALKSMSNHAGISSSKKATMYSRGRSIY